MIRILSDNQILLGYGSFKTTFYVQFTIYYGCFLLIQTPIFWTTLSQNCFCLEHISGKDNKARLDATLLGDSTPSKSTVCYWVGEFASNLGEPSTDRPIEMTTPENIKKFYKMFIGDRRTFFNQNLFYFSIRTYGEIFHRKYFT